MISPPLPTVGIAGGIGSGKSTVAQMIERSGVPVFSADGIAKEVSVSDQRIRRKILSLLGPESYLPDGTYNRGFVAKQIFRNHALQRKLESIVHPAVERELSRRLTDAKKQKAPWAAIEAALVFETKMDRWLDRVILVDAEPEIRIARVASRDASTAGEVQLRMSAQMNPKQARKRADFIIVNNGTLQELERNVRFVLTLLAHLFPKG